MATYEKAMALNEAATGVYLNRLGNTLARADHHLEAIETFKKAIAWSQKTPFIISILRILPGLGTGGSGRRNG